MRAGAVTRGGWPGILLIWAISVAGAVVVVALAYAGTADWFGDSTPLGVYGALGVVFAASVLGALAVQLASRRPDGFVDPGERERRRSGRDRGPRGARRGARRHVVNG